MQANQATSAQAPQLAAVADPMNQIPDQVNWLQTVAADLRNMVGKAETDLGKVLRPIAPGVAPSGLLAQSPAQTLVPLADELRELWLSLDRSVNQLRDILGRVEL